MSLLRVLYPQFSRPRGVIGEVVGWFLAARPSNRRRARWTLELLDLQPGHSLLDVGCGPGVALKIALRSTSLALAVGLDHSETVLSQARRRLARHPEVELLRGRLEEAELGDKRFDRICSMNVVQFMPDKAKAFATLKDLLNPGGRLATTYQPRGQSPTREAALAMADALSSELEHLGFINIRAELLDLKPAPALCVLGDLPVELGR
jgi:trans-aconitate methyltransferase